VTSAPNIVSKNRAVASGVLRAANYRPLRDDEAVTRQILFRTH
jgi:hypothetical protein